MIENTMRDLINLLENVLLTEKSRGLLYRDKGDEFFQGSKDNPTAEIVFDKVDYFPGQPGAYANYEEMAQAGQELFKQYPSITWTNKPTSSSKAFAILTFDGPGAGQKTHYGRFFSEIKQDMAGLWKNNELPGGWQLNKAVSLKGSYYKLKPADLFPANSTFDTPASCVAAMGTRPGTTPDQLATIDKIRPGMDQLLGGKLPTFENLGDMVTAVRDDLGETIGPIALVQGMITTGGAEVARKDILGPQGSYAGSAINFPAAKNNGLVDSYLLHPSGVQIGISSKGESGANASVKNIDDGIKVARAKGMDKLLDTYAPQVEIIENIGNMSAMAFPIEYGIEFGMITKEQARIIVGLIKGDNQALGNDLSTMKFQSDEDRENLLALASKVRAKTDNPRYNPGYHILSALARDVAVKINSDPMFGEACLKFLNTSPLIQLHLNGSDKAGNYTVTGFTSKYPPDFKGTVGLDASKVYAATGIIGRVSFSYNGGGNKDTDVPVDPTPAKTKTADLDVVGQQRSDVMAAPEEPKKYGTEKTLGRKRQK
jgi:hypothetical protein